MGKLKFFKTAAKALDPRELDLFNFVKLKAFDINKPLIDVIGKLEKAVKDDTEISEDTKTKLNNGLLKALINPDYLTDFNNLSQNYVHILSQIPTICDNIRFAAKDKAQQKRINEITDKVTKQIRPSAESYVNHKQLDLDGNETIKDWDNDEKEKYADLLIKLLIECKIQKFEPVIVNGESVFLLRNEFLKVCKNAKIRPELKALEDFQREKLYKVVKEFTKYKTRLQSYADLRFEEAIVVPLSKTLQTIEKSALACTDDTQFPKGTLREYKPELEQAAKNCSKLAAFCTTTAALLMFGGKSKIFNNLIANIGKDDSVVKSICSKFAKSLSGNSNKFAIATGLLGLATAYCIAAYKMHNKLEVKHHNDKIQIKRFIDTANTELKM